MATQLRVEERNTRANVIKTALGASPVVNIYSGTKPVGVATALSGNTLLAELPCSATVAPDASGGVLTFNAITTDASANNSGTATFYRIATSGGTAIIQGDIADLNQGTTIFTAGLAVSLSSFTITEGNA